MKRIIYLLATFSLLSIITEDNVVNSNDNRLGSIGSGYKDFSLFYDDISGENVFGSAYYYFLNVNSLHSDQTVNFFKNMPYVPENEYGICTFIAESLVLTYYDTFYNNNVVSPGQVYPSWVDVLDENTIDSPSIPEVVYDFDDPTSSKFWYYYNCIYPTRNSNIMSNLISQEVELYNNNHPSIFNRQDPFAIDVETLSDMEERYIQNKNIGNLFNRLFISPDDDLTVGYGNTYPYEFSSTNKTTSNQYKSTILSYVKAGYPVLTVHAFLEGSASIQMHALVAYDYYDDGLGNEEIIYHSGYDCRKKCVANGNYVIAAYSILIPTTYANHVCSDNYAVNEIDVCPHTFNNHTHKYISYLSNNNLTHKKICYCDYYTNEAHSIYEYHNVSYCQYCNFHFSGNGPIYLSSNNPIYFPNNASIYMNRKEEDGES